ncbi:hypothetical protein IQ246_25490 [aff. Roholtiella sp. LEGE 12411]|uniref:hypothetical protein n=1 Tax=aff. Roholtiella sp. LEGE 12411 TaxID=1828822 RepID=UPI001881A6D6|nr:hypothetical protein [aff. Roholtiella sp. LEGE 12411]MBE9038395.1 hypothetical protein [aff. Roholtiella sp. LEGE 12411]
MVSIIFRTYATGTQGFWYKSQGSRGATALGGSADLKQVAFKGQESRFFGLLTFDSGQPLALKI